MACNHKHVNSQAKETIIFDIYQLNPSFYKKITSRSSSFSFNHQNSCKSYSGKVPFIWEIQPGTPRHGVSVDDAVKPIRFPPAIYSLTVPKPSIPPTGAKAYFMKNLQRVKKIKNLQIQIPKFEFHKPNSAIRNVKVYLLKNLKKVEKIKSRIGKKPKPPAAGEAAEADERMNRTDSDGFESSYYDFDDFIPSHKNSTPSVISPAPRRSYSLKSPKLLRFRSMQKGSVKWNFTKRKSENY